MSTLELLARTGALLVLCAAATGCSKPNDQTCATNDDCASGYCDLQQGRCAEPPDGGAADAAGPDATPECVTSAECSEPAEPICDDQVCRACGTGPECETRDPAAPYCALDGRCAECLTSGQCEVPTAPICDAATLACRACVEGAAGDADCAARAAAQPRCASDGACVGCLDSADCSGTTPFCESSTRTCRACQAHSECASEICEITTGACVPTGDIIYVALTGTDTAGCGGQGAACRTIDGTQGAIPKVTTTRRWIRVRAGTFAESVTVTTAITVTIVGDGSGSTVIAPPPTNVPGVLTDNGADVTLEALMVTGASGGTSADGVRCASGSRCTLRRVIVQTNGDMGVEVSGGNATIEDSQILDNVGKGVNAIGGGSSVVEVKRSVVRGNDAGGLVAGFYNFRFVNNFVVENGANASGSIGGVYITGDPPNAIADLTFNTIVNNIRKSTETYGGISVCSVSSVSVVGSNNIVWGNTSGEVDTSGGCTYVYSNIQGGVGGTGNINTTPGFVSGSDYHITSGSLCRNAADPTATLATDIDGQARPEGGRSDIGADEFWP